MNLLGIRPAALDTREITVLEGLDALDAHQSRSKDEKQQGYTVVLNDVSARVRALYGQPGFETWALIGKTLRLSRGSAWSLAHGLRHPDPRTLEYLDCAEWRLSHLSQAAANLAGMIGVEPHPPTVFARANKGDQP